LIDGEIAGVAKTMSLQDRLKMFKDDEFPGEAPRGFSYSKLGLAIAKYFDVSLYYSRKYYKDSYWRQFRMLDFNANFVPLKKQVDGDLSFKHSGNAGDIIYSLPTIKALVGDRFGKLSLQLDVPISSRYIREIHPLGGCMLNRDMYNMLIPLLEYQSYIDSVDVFTGDPVEYDLDQVRSFPIPKDRIGISRWYFHLFGVAPDLSESWLDAPKEAGVSDVLLISRSRRYQNLCIDYAFLSQYDNLAFCGVEEEYVLMRKVIPRIEWIPVDDFLHLATLIHSSKLFIGNQSFPFSIAEGLKSPRILEVYPLAPDVVPTGGRCCDVLFQKQFEQMVDEMMN